MTSRQCKNDPNKFCYICDELTFAKEKRSITSHIKKLYKAYFHCDIGDQEKTWVPQVCCLTCVKTLSAWYANKNIHIKIGVPMIWRERKDHSNDCYFCQQDYTGCTTAKKKKHIVYPNLQSAMRPVKYSKELPVLKPPNQEMWSLSSGDEHCSNETVELFYSESKNKPIPFSQEALNYLCRDLYLTKDKSELLASRLKECNLLQEGVKITLYQMKTERERDTHNLSHRQTIERYKRHRDSLDLSLSLSLSRPI